MKCPSKKLALSKIKQRFAHLYQTISNRKLQRKKVTRDASMLTGLHDTIRPINMQLCIWQNSDALSQM